MAPELSIVIPSHNRPDLLRACLSTALRHAPAGTEVLVVDDGSPDDVVARVTREFPTARSLRLPARRGFCAAANAGIRAVRGGIVELLNDDTEVAPGWAEAALAAFQDPAIGAVAPLVLCRPTSRKPPVGPPRLPEPAKTPLIDSAGDRYYLGGIAGKRGHRRPLDARYLQRCRVFGASASSAFFRREVLLRVGAFPESFGAYFEDVDLAFRLHWAGYDVQFEPESRVFHHVSASYGRPQWRLLEQQSRNEERVFWRNLPAWDLLRALPHHVAVLAAKAWQRRQGEGLAPFLCGRLRILGEIPTLLQHRRWLRTLGPARRARVWAVEDHFWGMTG